MIKENEIRVNNYLKYVGYSSFAKTQGLFKWDETDWFKLLDESFSLEDVEPIPLTEDWLLKFGFKNKSFKTNFHLEIGDSQLEINIRNKNHCWLNGRFLKNINHVHQLQNLYFALTNEELTLKD